MDKAKDFLLKHCRKLDYLRLCHLEENKSDEILKELLSYQNDDGGFGNALEADLRTLSSSAVATEFAINVLEEIDEVPESLIKEIIGYLEATINDRNYWTISPDDVEDYPHAVWWNKDRLDGFGTMNPSATLIGFLYKYKHLTQLNVDQLLNNLIEEILVTEVNDIEEHTLLCLCRLLRYIGLDYNRSFTEKIDEAIYFVIDRDPANWVNYAPEPIKYITSPNHRLYLENKDIVDKNILYLLESRSEDCTWKTKHRWGQYEEVFDKTAKIEWEGVFTVDNYKVLQAFNK
ncbi:hypothetical protein EZV73_01415 [Acidaminobacter sp. JC074]|uniref:hypothetical protein n=1 Tax=Acidaminobacter sp. JC074 TaxID=2530199 RepID=UPI001F0D40EF|nr:hypothetical protein [Acidaminobacter sp. JC074]MCH4886202.1 hypothetical protein [Acidaminobacter sp. JC074]